LILFLKELFTEFSPNQVEKKKVFYHESTKVRKHEKRYYLNKAKKVQLSAIGYSLFEEEAVTVLYI